MGTSTAEVWSGSTTVHEARCASHSAVVQGCTMRACMMSTTGAGYLKQPWNIT